MVNSLYYVIDIIFVILLSIMLFHDIRTKHEINKLDNAYRFLLVWVLIFCMQDAFWGYCASGVFKSDIPLIISSAIFHISTVLTTFFWLFFILTYMRNKIKMKTTLLCLGGLVVILQIILVIINFSHPIIFSVRNGEYTTEFLRPLAFFNQYVVYLAMSIFTCVAALSVSGEKREKYISVFTFTLAPVLSGGFQLLYPDGPFYSMGYFLGCFLICMYVIAQERTNLIKVQSLREAKKLQILSNTDALTGLPNRRSYETSLADSSSAEQNYTYISIDINGLKVVNDTLGHIAGDELIKGASVCMNRCLSPYGKVYRIGGDEFAAIIYASEAELERITKDFEETTANWKGDLVKEISMSYGIVAKREFSSISTLEIAKIADERMYAAKEEYYSKKGIDRKGVQAAYLALCTSYTKILKINITDDSFNIIKMNVAEQISEMGFADKISKWLYNFGKSGQVHPEDLENYLSLTNKEYMNKFFDGNKKNLNIFYRRKSVDGFRMTKMEMIPAEDYNKRNKKLYLYVKDIDSKNPES